MKRYTSSCINLAWFLQCEFKTCKVYFGWISSHLPFLDGYFWALNTTTIAVIFISYQRRRTFLPIQNFKHKWVRMWVYSMNTYYHRGLYLQTVLQTPVFNNKKTRSDNINGIWEIPFSPICTNIELVDNIYNTSMFCLKQN